MRVVSLLPSATEIVCALGRVDDLVAITHSCELPPGARELPRVTSTAVPLAGTSREIDTFVRAAANAGEALYALDQPAIRALAPDLIVTQGLCAVCAVDERSAFALSRSLHDGVRVLSLTPHGLESTFAAIDALGGALYAEAAARALLARLRARVARVAERSASVKRRPRVAYLEWLDPPFSCGHWGPELVRLAGGVEVIGRDGQASRTLDWKEIAAAAPEVVLAACCGLSAARTQRELSALAAQPHWRALEAVRAGRVFVADGDSFFSRPGPGLVDSLELLAHALHPELHPPHERESLQSVPA